MLSNFIYSNMKKYVDFIGENVKWYSKGKLVPDDTINIYINKYDDFITDDEFRDFLIKNDAYGRFIKNVENLKPKFKNKFSSCDRKDYINYAFNWEDTDENYDFWSDLDYDWKDIIKK